MPLYTYKCLKCGKIEDAYRSIDDRNNSPECHGNMEKIIVPTMVQPMLPEYLCPVTGEFVTSRVRRREIMKENNLYEKG